jgi:hypothetical protein
MASMKITWMMRAAALIVAGMAGALDAYQALRARHPDFELALFERLAAARADHAFAEVVERIAAGVAEE